MAENTQDSLIYYLLIDNNYIDCLGAIRQWDNVKLGFDGDRVWAKDLNLAQINSISIKSIPRKQVFYLKDNKLYLKDSLLPHCKVPSLLWTPVERALPLSLPSYNNNYFGLDKKIDIGLDRSEEEREVFALKTSISHLRSYIESAPAMRLNRLYWTIIEDTAEVLIIGTPLLPLTGAIYWKLDNMLLPAGYNFKYYYLLNDIRKKINAEDAWIIWSVENTYCIINKNDFEPLSLSSFRKSVKTVSSKQ